MSTTERRAGQRWRWQQGTVDKEFVIERRNKSNDGWIVRFPDEAPVRGSEPWFGDRDWAGTLCTLTLLSDVPAPQPEPCKAPDRTRCKAWCGYGRTDARARGFSGDHSRWVISDEEWWEGPVWCSPACRDARVPPLESKPAETGKHGSLSKCGKWFYGESVAQSADARTGHEANCIDCNPMLQPTQYREPHAPAQEAPKAPKCWCNGEEIACTGGVLQRPALPRFYLPSRPWCEAHWVLRESRTHVSSSGKPYAGRERLERPKLAHSHGLEDPALEDAP